MPYLPVAICMLVVLGVFLFQAKARIVMAEAKAPLSPRQKLVRYLVMVALWAILTAVVFVFVFARTGKS